MTRLARYALFTISLTSCAHHQAATPAPMQRSSITVGIEGVLGGSRSETISTSATVQAIDRKARIVTVSLPNGGTEALAMAPSLVVAEGIAVGDRVEITYEIELHVRLKPRDGGRVAEAERDGRIKALDREKREAMLAFTDGRTRSFRIRDDLDIATLNVGDEILFRVERTRLDVIRK